MKYLYLFLAIVIIVAICLCSLPYWQTRYPAYIEFYKIPYHIASAVGFQRCGGFTLNNFWAAQQAGESTNTYFPFFQFIELLMLVKGVSIYFLTYWLTWIFLPLAFLTMLAFMYSLYGARTSAYAIGFLSLSPIFLEQQWMNPPQALAFILILLVFLALLKRRYVACLILVLCCIATHSIGLVVLPCLFLYALHEREFRKPIMILLGITLLLGTPVFWLLSQRIKYGEIQTEWFIISGLTGKIRTALATMFEIKHQNHVFLGWLAFAGLIVCHIKKGKFLILPSIFIGLFPLALTQQDVRFWGLPAITIFSLLAAVFFGTIQEAVEKIKFGKLIGVGFFVSVLILAGFLFYRLSDVAVQLKTPTLIYLNRPDIWHYPKIYSMDEKARIIELVKEHVAPDEFFYIHGSYYFNDYVSACSQRSAFFPKKIEELSQDNIKLVVERFHAPSNDYRFLEKVNEEFDFSAYVLADTSKAKAAKFIMPKPWIKAGQLLAAFVIMGLLVLIDLLAGGIAKFRRIFIIALIIISLFIMFAKIFYLNKDIILKTKNTIVLNINSTVLNINNTVFSMNRTLQNINNALHDLERTAVFIMDRTLQNINNALQNIKRNAIPVARNTIVLNINNTVFNIYRTLQNINNALQNIKRNAIPVARNTIINIKNSIL